MDKALLREHAEGLIGLSGCLKGEVAGRALPGQLRRGRQDGLPRVRGDLRQGQLLRRAHGPRPAAADRDPAGPPPAFPRNRRAGRGDQRQPLPAPRRRLRPRGPPLHRHGQDARGRAPDALLQRRVLRQGSRRDEGALRAAGAARPSPTPWRSRSAAPWLSTRRASTSRPSRRPTGRRPRSYFARARPRGARSAPARACEPRFRAGRIPIPPEKYRERLEYEIGVIEKMGFPSYFLIVSDFIRYARESGISVGPGRGSAAGSIVSWALRDHRDRPAPIRPPLRALPEPRADLDARHRHRLLPGAARRGHRVRHPEVRAGERRADRDVLAVEAEARRPGRGARSVAAGRPGRPDRQARPGRAGRELRARAQGVARASRRRWRPTSRSPRSCGSRSGWRGSRGTRGCTPPASSSRPRPIIEYLPLYRTNKDEITTQFDMNAVEKMGLLKIDFLGLITLDIIDAALEAAVRERTRRRRSTWITCLSTTSRPTSSSAPARPPASSSSTRPACGTCCAAPSPGSSRISRP